MSFMKHTDSRVDEYIKNAQPFAQPILRHIRELMHKGCPDLTEGMKWGMPFFEYHGVIASMAAFKEHAVFGFWKEDLIPGMKQYIKEKEAMGSWGRITSLEGIPPDNEIIAFVKVAAKLNEQGVKSPKRKPKPVVVNMHDDFMKVIKANKKALETYENFSPSNKRDYAVWINDAKTDETRKSRMQKAVQWMSEGKPRMWKYMKK
jgi:uncharacterized protein YdeI (YjbR/CyaY-like superfamily)